MHRVSLVGGVFICSTIAFTVIGQLLVKAGMLDVGASPSHLSLLPHFIWRAFTDARVILGLAAAVLAAVCWTIAVSRTDLSVAYPFVGLGIVLVLALSGLVFNEAVPAHRWLGVAIVCLGLVVAARH